MYRRRPPARWIAFALRMLGVAVVAGFLGGAVLASEHDVDPTVQLDFAELVEDLEPDGAIPASVETADIVRVPRECRAIVARTSTAAPDIRPAVPPPRA